ncbi:MAG TPA: hypothetical protein VMW54_14665 [Terriglobia bacterium]|nr:hypothetical protein [Terriglobia bacterium]
MGTNRVRFTKVTGPKEKQTKWNHRDIRSPSFMDAALTVEWLNAAKGTTAYRRVLALRTELEALRAELDRPFPALHWKTATQVAKQSVEDARRLNKFTDRHRQLNLLLGRYAFKNAMAYNLHPTGSRWWLTLIPKKPRGPQIEIENEIGFPKIRVTEPWVSVALARLAVSRELGKVHLCTNCRERWHVALRSIDQFCGSQCREHYHIHSDAYREKKRASQQEYRQRLREGFGSKKGEQHHGKR